jgi:hypothetical protein
MHKFKKTIFRSIIFLYFLFFLCAGLSAQKSLGIYGGVTSINLAGDGIGLAVYRPHVGWYAGTILDVPLSKDVFFSIRPGVSFNMLRIQAADTVQLRFRTKLVYEDSVKVSLNTFKLPLLIKVVTDNRRFHFTSGIELDYLFTARWNNGVEKINVLSELDRFNASVVFGVGYSIPVRSTQIAMDLSYSQGIMNISSSQTNRSALPRIKTKGFRFLISWTLPVNKSQK